MPRVDITGDDRRWNKVAAVEHNGGWKLFLPFRKDSIRQAVVVGDDLLVCLSDEGEIRLINWRTGVEIARRKVARYWCKILVTSNKKFIILYYRDLDPYSFFKSFVHVLTVPDLITASEGNALLWDHTKQIATLVNADYPYKVTSGGPNDPVMLNMLTPIIEDNCGRLRFTCCNYGPSGSLPYGICKIDQADWSMRFEPIPDTSGRWVWFSPSGQYVVAEHFRTLAYDDGFLRLSLLPAWRKHPRHPDGRFDGIPRFGTAVEIWETDPPKLITTVIVRMAHLNLHPNDDRKLDAWIKLAKS